MTTPQDAPDPPSWFDIAIAAVVAIGFAAWAWSIYGAQGLEAALGAGLVAVWTAGFAGLRFAARRRILAGREPTAHQAGLERGHRLAGAILFTVLGVIAAKQGEWLTAAGFLIAAAVFGFGGARARPAP